MRSRLVAQSHAWMDAHACSTTKMLMPAHWVLLLAQRPVASTSDLQKTAATGQLTLVACLLYDTTTALKHHTLWFTLRAAESAKGLCKGQACHVTRHLITSTQ
jgi:hypothetical protein